MDRQRQAAQRMVEIINAATAAGGWTPEMQAFWRTTRDEYGDVFASLDADLRATPAMRRLLHHHGRG